MSAPSEAFRLAVLAELGRAPDRLGELQARAAASGWSIIQTADGYTVGRWGMSRTLPDLPAVEAFIRRAMRDKP